MTANFPNNIELSSADICHKIGNIANELLFGIVHNEKWIYKHGRTIFKLTVNWFIVLIP